MDIESLRDEIVETLEDKKALQVEVIEVADKTMLAEYFIIASGNSNTQVKAIVNDVLTDVEKKFSLKPQKLESDTRNRWNILDYRDIVVHIFHQEERDYFQLEKLWHGPLSIDITDN